MPKSFRGKDDAAQPCPLEKVVTDSTSVSNHAHFHRESLERLHRERRSELIAFLARAIARHIHHSEFREEFND